MNQFLGWESAREKFTNTWMGKVVDLAQQALWDTEFVNTKLFPRQTNWDDTIDDTYNLKMLYPAPYKQQFGSAAVDNTPDRTTKTTLDAWTKAIIRQLDPRKFKWVGLANTAAVQQWRELHENAERVVSEMIQQIEITNEKECWDTLTSGVLTLTGGYTFTLPIHGITNLSPGISYHTRKSWFTNTGDVITTASVSADIEAALKYTRLNHFDKITTVWMNSTTWEAIYNNTRLSNTGGDLWWQPIQTTAIKGGLMDFQDRSKIVMLGSLPFYGLKVIINDSFYRTAGGVQTMFLPDYYVVYTPNVVGTRYVLPNDTTWVPERYIKNWVTPPPAAPGLNFEAGETSACYPNNRGNLDTTTGLCTWKSHYVQYVKAP